MKHLNVSQLIHLYPFLFLLFPLVVGIVCADLWGMELPACSLLGGAGMVVVGYFARRTDDWLSKLFGVGVCLLLFCLGNRLASDELSKSEFAFKETASNYYFRLISYPEEKNRTLQFEARLQGEGGQKFLLYFQKDSACWHLKRGDELRVNARLSLPEQIGTFDYPRYLRRKGIAGTAYIPSRKWVILQSDSAKSLLQEAKDRQIDVVNLYRRLGMSGDELSVLSALTVGYKEELSPDIKQLYSATGASHVLALSGLHIGLLYLILWFGFRRLVYYIPWMKPLALCLIIALLWGFALFTGLSPSVVRAVFMYSLLLLSSCRFDRPLSVNNLLITAFFMLLFKPLWLFDVGFQLSFMALFFLLRYHPPLSRLWHFHNPVLKYVWALLTASVAAQIGVAPLVAYYFHSFPTHFLLTNLLVIPLVTLVLYATVSLLLLTPFPAAQQWVADGVQCLLRFQNHCLLELDKLPLSSIESLHLMVVDVPILYLLIFLVDFWLRHFYHSIHPDV